MNILSLFDGISCGRIALERAGIKIDNYYSSEIDKNAIKVSESNYHDIIRLGDVTKWREWNLPKIDLLLAGSPCTGFSSSGKGLNFNDPQSKLFFEFVDILKFHKPKYFLLENVKMKKEYSDRISEILGVDFIKINSSLVSAQNRVRYYWTNIPNVVLPEDKNIKLVDIIEQDYDGIWVWPRGGNKGGIKNYNEKAPCVTTSSWEHNFLIYQGAALRTFPRQPTGEKRIKRLEIRKDDKANCLTCAEYDSIVTRPEGTYRKFIPIEAEKLQTLPENYTSSVSNSQRYKCIGNGWTVDVITHILKNISDENN